MAGDGLIVHHRSADSSCSNSVRRRHVRSIHALNNVAKCRLSAGCTWRCSSALRCKYRPSRITSCHWTVSHGAGRSRMCPTIKPGISTAVGGTIHQVLVPLSGRSARVIPLLCWIIQFGDMKGFGGSGARRAARQHARQALRQLPGREQPNMDRAVVGIQCGLCQHDAVMVVLRPDHPVLPDSVGHCRYGRAVDLDAELRLGQRVYYERARSC